MLAFFSSIAARTVLIASSVFLLSLNGPLFRMVRLPVMLANSVVAAQADSSSSDKKKTKDRRDYEEYKRSSSRESSRKRGPVSVDVNRDGIRIETEDGEVIYIDPENIVDGMGNIIEGLDLNLDDSLLNQFGLYEDDLKYRKIKGDDIVRFGKDIHIRKNEMVQGDVFSIMGDVIVEGKVRGNVISVMGNIELDSTAIVNGDVVSVLGSLNDSDGARVRGETITVARDLGDIPVGPFIFGSHGYGGGFFKILGRIVMFIIGALLMLLIIYFLPSRMKESSSYIFGSFFKSLGVGILVIIFGSIIVAILVAILSITIIGIPVAILLALSFAALIFLGYFVSAYALGHFVTGRMKMENESPFISGILGLFLLAVLGLLGNILWFLPFFTPARYLLNSLGGFVNFLAVFTGTGAFIISKAGTIKRETRAQLPE